MTTFATIYLNNNDAKSALLFAYYYRYGFFSLFFNASLHNIDYRSFLLRLVSLIPHSSYKHCSRHQFYLINLHNTINLAHEPKTGEEADGTC